METLGAWCMDEIRRMEDARAHLAWLLEEMEAAAELPLLESTLQEQRGMNVAQRERFERIYASVGQEGGGRESTVALAMVTEARDALRSLTGLDRDVAIAQHAVRIELWELGVWTGLYAVLRQADLHAAADEVAALVADLRSAERHLEAVHPDADEAPDEHERRTTSRHRPRLSLNVGPAE